MYLSRIAIDPENRNTLRALHNPEILHGMVESCFEGERKRTLWRIDELRGQLYLLILSPHKPDFSSLASQIGMPDSAGETREYTPLLQRATEGTVWRFRLTANPTASIVNPGKERGKRKAITIAAHQREWLVKQGDSHGFSLAPNQFDVVRSEWRIFQNKGRKISILSATFEGVLTVTDSELFGKALTEGIGRGKAYGMGLITVMTYA